MEPATPLADAGHKPASTRQQILRVLLLFALLFVFLVAINLMSSAFKAMGKETAEALFNGVANPFAGLAVGILATVLVQSSSVSTSTIVALVGSGQLGVPEAVPMIMGANIGTTITNTLVSMGNMRRSAEFRRAFAAATVHDFFNVITVGILLTAELLTGFLAKSATYIAKSIPISEDATGFKSPIKQVVKDACGLIQDGLEGIGLLGTPLAIVMLALALGLIFFSLVTITRTMRLVIASRVERVLNAALAKSGLIGIVIGAGMTMAVQSSSITTSLLVPLCGAGILSLRNAFPVMLGANIGTTITALIASMATDTNGLTIALVHLLFNISGVLLFYPIAPLRQIPIACAEKLADMATRSRGLVFLYVLVVFVAIPFLGILIFK